MTRPISTTAAAAAAPSLMLTQAGQVRRLEKIFWMMTLLARNMVMRTLNNNRMLAHRGWGLAPMN